MAHLRESVANLLVHSQVNGDETVVANAGQQEVAIAGKVQRGHFTLQKDLIVAGLGTLIPEANFLVKMAR